jgi:hypothetical protein
MNFRHEDNELIKLAIVAFSLTVALCAIIYWCIQGSL